MMKKLFEELKAAVESAEDAERFKALVDRSMTELQMLDKDVSAALRVSRTTVTRWRNGLSVPHPLMRPSVLRIFLEKLVPKRESK